MKEQSGTLSGSGEKWLQDFIEEVSTQLSVRREIDTLSARIPREDIEIGYLTFKGETALKRLDETQEAIDDIVARKPEFQEEIGRIRRQRQSAIEAYDRLKGKETRVAGILDDLPGMRNEIEEMEKGIRKASEELAALQENHEKLLHWKEILDQECSDFRAEIKSVEEETAVMKTTRDIIGGSRPDTIDSDVFDSLQDDVAATVEAYLEEMGDETDNIKGDITRLDGQLADEETKEKTLRTKKTDLQALLDDLRTQVEPSPDKDALEAEVDALKKNENEIASNTREAREEIRLLEPELETLDRTAAVEREGLDSVERRISDLMPIKQEMSKFDNLDREIERLKNETVRLIVDSQADRAQGDVIGTINSEMESTRRQLLASIDTYTEKIETLKQEINKFIH